MKRIKILLLASVIFGCTQQQKLKTDSQDSSIVDSVSSVVSTPKPDQVFYESLQYNYIPELKLKLWEGKMQESAYWKDQRGENILIISELPQYFWKELKPQMAKLGGDDDNSEVAELFAYHYIYDQKESKWKLYWSLNDFQFSCCDVQMSYLPGSLKITDLDSNGKAESVFTYHTTVGTQSMDLNYDGKLMLHVDSTKYSVKGLVGLFRNRVDPTAKNQYSENFSKSNPSYKTYAENMWKRSLAIRDSMDEIIKKQWPQN